MNAVASSSSLPIHPSRLFWLLQTCGWLGYFALAGTAAIGEGKPWHWLFFYFGVAVVGFAITSILRLGYRHVWSLPFPRMLPRAAAMLIGAAMLMGFLYARGALGFCTDCETMSGIFGYIWYVTSMLYLLLSWSGLYFGIKFAQQLQEQKEAALKAQSLAHEAQLKMLRYQLNPHFLFNTLNAISTLVLDNRGDTANRMVVSLSSFLRTTLDADPVQRVTVAQEIDALNLYLEIEQVRFGDRLRVKIDVDPNARNALVPSLLMQPIIENAIKHAISKSEQGGTIHISAQPDDSTPNQSWLNLHLCDDGPGCDSAANGNGQGVGLVNVRERLRVLYGARATVTIAPQVPRGTDVHIRLPYENAAASVHVE